MPLSLLMTLEGINTDPGVEEVLSGNREEAIVHVAAEVFYLLELRRRELMKISGWQRRRRSVQDIADGVRIAIGDTAVIFGKIPSVASGAPDVGVSLEFINADGLGSFLSSLNWMASKTD